MNVNICNIKNCSKHPKMLSVSILDRYRNGNTEIQIRTTYKSEIIRGTFSDSLLRMRRILIQSADDSEIENIIFVYPPNWVIIDDKKDEK